MPGGRPDRRVAPRPSAAPDERPTPHGRTAATDGVALAAGRRHLRLAGDRRLALASASGHRCRATRAAGDASARSRGADRGNPVRRRPDPAPGAARRKHLALPAIAVRCLDGHRRTRHPGCRRPAARQQRLGDRRQRTRQPALLRPGSCRAGRRAALHLQAVPESLGLLVGRVVPRPARCAGRFRRRRRRVAGPEQRQCDAALGALCRRHARVHAAGRRHRHRFGSGLPETAPAPAWRGRPATC